MNTTFSTLDSVIFAAYALLILGVGLWVSRSKDGEKSAEDYFLASKSLPWWAIGASLIAANISAEQFIGMSGSGFTLGLAIASYEWMAATSIFIEKGLYTIPEFVEKRYSPRAPSFAPSTSPRSCICRWLWRPSCRLVSGLTAVRWVECTTCPGGLSRDGRVGHVVFGVGHRVRRSRHVGGHAGPDGRRA